MSIQVKNVEKRFGDFVALDNVSLDFEEGELTALLGPSGCGKTTLLRIIAGLERADAGQIVLAGRDASEQHVRQRQVGFVFQHYALFKHMSVFENVAFGLRVKPRNERPSEAKIREKVKSLLELVQLDWLANRYPAQLSGGQRQRIALARALAVEPRVLLLDEPFGALDAKVRKELRRWLRRLHDELHVTSVFVTHDQEEALEVADQVVLMNRGHVEQFGSPEAVYNHPATPFVFGFLGNVNLFHGRLEVGDSGGLLHIGEAVLPVVGSGHETAGDAVAYVRPHDLDIERYAPGTDGIAVTLRRALTLGPVAQLELEREDNQDVIEVALPLERFRHAGFREGELLAVRPRQLRVFTQHTQQQSNARAKGAASSRQGARGSAMNFQQLRSIREAVRRQFNLTEVANALYTSQPGVSRQIRELEEELGVEIFERYGKRLTGLTEPGREIVRIVERLLLEAENLRQAGDEFAGRHTGRLTVATTHTQARYALPKVVQSFRREYPHVTLALQEASPTHIVELLLTGQADIGIATEALATEAGLTSFDAYTWQHVLVVSPDHPLTLVPEPTLEDLAGFPLITYDAGFTGRRKIDGAFAEAGLQPEIVLTALDADVIKTYAELELGVGIIASMAYDDRKDSGLVRISADHLFDSNTTSVAVRRGSYLRGYAHAFINMFAPHLSRDTVSSALGESDTRQALAA